MRLEEYGFSALYHGFVTIDAGEKVKKLSGAVKINEKDRYVLCGCHVNEEGMAVLHALAVGPDYEHCTRGLGRNQILGLYPMSEVYDCEARVAEPDSDMVRKDELFRKNISVNEDMEQLRLDERLDPFRDVFYPDEVSVQMPLGEVFEETDVRLTGIRGPLATGVNLLSLHGCEEGETVLCAPFYTPEGMVLCAMAAGGNLSEMQEALLNEMIVKSEEAGVDFSGFVLRS